MATRHPAPFRNTAVLAALAGLLLCLPAQRHLFAAAQQGSGLPTLGYTRVLKGSNPEYIAITVMQDGTGTYDGREIAGPPKPVPIKVSDATTQRLFSLASSLNNFQSVDLESHKKVANLGEKTFTYSSGGKESSASFNYTLKKEAQELNEIFDGISAVEQHVLALQFAIKYDPLSLPKELMQVQYDLANKSLADPQMMVPTLDQIARNPRFLHLAKSRAQDILDRIQK